MAVLPRASRFDEVRVRGSGLDPVLNALGDELRAVVTLDDPRMSATLDELVENPNHIVRVQEPGAFDPDRFASELVDHRQESKSPAVDRLIGNEVIAPNVIRVERSIFLRRSLARSKPFSLLLRHLQAFSLPNQSETVPAHRKAFGP